MTDHTSPTPVSRRAFARLAALASLSALLEACLPAAPTTIPDPTGAPTPLPLATLPPPALTPTSTQTPVPSANPSAAPPTESPGSFDDLANAALRRIAALIQGDQPPHARLVVRPLDGPGLELNFGGGEFQRSASTIKALVLLYALFKNPALDLSPPDPTRRAAADAYRMIVSSNNGATAHVLADAVAPDDLENAFNSFNDFLHNILLLPPTVGLTRWAYYPTEGVKTNRLTTPTTAEFPSGIPNPITLNVLADFFELLESPAALENAAARASGSSEYYDPDVYPTRQAYRAAALAAADRARGLLSIPDPEYETQMDFALADAVTRYPDLAFSMYGKNGTISPADWDLNRWHINEAVVLTVAQGERILRAIIAFSASSFATAALLGAAIDYSVDLLRAGG